MNTLLKTLLKSRRFWSGTAMLLLSSCVANHRQLPLSQTFDTEVGSVQLMAAEVNPDEMERIEIAIAAAMPRLKVWGTLRQPVRLYVMPTHGALEDAVGKNNLPWLRAWARYDEVFLQTPRSWTLWGARQQDINEMLLHELTHCLMYQMAASDSSWREKGMPFWFKEGMASWTAEQGFRWPKLEQLALQLNSQKADPLKQPEAFARHQIQLAYGAAHHAFVFLERRYGVSRIQEMLAFMHSGESFESAFKKGMGLSSASFLNDFRRYVSLRGFRSGRLKTP